MHMSLTAKKWGKFFASALIIFLTLFLLQRLLDPKYVADVVEGAFIAEYYDEVKDHDVIFIGDCEVYENFSPIILWQDYGINSYIRGSAEQYIFQSYYLRRIKKDDDYLFTPLDICFLVAIVVDGDR